MSEVSPVPVISATPRASSDDVLINGGGGRVAVPYFSSWIPIQRQTQFSGEYLRGSRTHNDCLTCPYRSFSGS